MGFEDYKKDDGGQGRLLKWILAVVALVHIVFLFVGPSDFYRSPIDSPSEWVIETDLLSLSDKELKEVKSERMLPQVPKRFKLDVPEKKDDDPLALEKEEEKKNTVRIKKKENDEKIKKIGLDRLLKELRREKKIEKKKTEKKVKLSQSLQERKKLLELEKWAEVVKVGEDKSGYSGVLKQQVHKYFSLPDIHDLANRNIKTVVQLSLNRSGDVETLALKRSSKLDVFDQLVLRAVRDASPFPPPPKEWVARPILLNFEPTGNQ